ncbi:methylmalonyl-CoA epimerase, mitochondrial [Galendromus occidentalis]|uniref:Methylmalonyl-CoA epimerase, mitochondrial n=1 Tax=Galendromus occidentalis TaxID=34638 RepID=A0AAJ6QTD7_9ACAR|nr:methylmalonyl-CoA epimerase, mitochondrial [Galendromus occidentalis]
MKLLRSIFTARRFATNSGLRSLERNFKITRLNHVSVATNAVDKQRTFWSDVMGLQVSSETPQPDHGVTTVFVSLDNTKLELLEPMERSPISAFLKQNKDGGMHHLCLEVDNIRAAMEHVQKCGVRCLNSEPEIGAHGKPVVFLHPKDCGGVLIELEEA